MLEKFGVPGAVRLAALPPEQDEFRNLAGGEIPGNIGQLQYFKEIFAGLPIFTHGAGFAVIFKGGGKARPLGFNVADKIRIPGAADIAALAPVKNKLGNGILNKIEADTSLAIEQFNGIL